MIALLKAMARQRRDLGPFDPEYTPAYTTIQTGVVHGGTALNIVPKDCAFDFEFRLLPGEDPEAGIGELRAFAENRLLPEMRAVRPEAAIEFEELSAFPGLDTPHDAEITRLVASLTGANATAKVSFGTEGGLFQAGRHRDHRLRSGLDRAGAQAGRVHRPRSDRPMRAVYRPHL